MNISEEEFAEAIEEIRRAINFEYELARVMEKYNFYYSGTPSDTCVDLSVDLLAELTDDSDSVIEEFCFGQPFINGDQSDGIVVNGKKIKTPEDLYEYLDANWRGDYDQ